MLRRLVPALLTVSLGAIPLGTGCMRTAGVGPAFPQPIRDEKEPGESLDTVSAVPDSGSTGVEEMTSSSENDVEIDEGDSSASDGDGKEGEKSADKSDDQAGDDGGEDETGDEPDDPSDIDVGSDRP